jgi:SAM-dependent methyltransferase
MVASRQRGANVGESRGDVRIRSGILTALLLFGGTSLLAFARGLVGSERADAAEPVRRVSLWVGAATLGLGVLRLSFGARVRRVLEPSAERFTAGIETLAGHRRAPELVLASMLGLFLEVLLIRWHGCELRAAAYFKNITLLASFLGLGLGFATAGAKRISLLSSPPALAAQVLAICLMASGGADEILKLPAGPQSEWIWGVPVVQVHGLESGAEHVKAWLQASMFYGFYAALFVSTILVFRPIGQLTGRLMIGSPPVRAYTLNILGSLLGVGLFGLVSWLRTPPVVWFAVAAAIFMFLLRHERIASAVGGGAIAVLLAACGAADVSGVNVYSPYQRLEIHREVATNDSGERLDLGALISANKAYHLRTINLAPPFVEANGPRFALLRRMEAAYGVPYSFVKNPSRVLVVGAGGGNDVESALRHGAGHVDAVEIDPAIVDIGRTMHAERPYDDPRVTVHVNDARAFMRHAAGGRYDLIVFGLLDSHTLLSGMAAVRLDNFVYTIESLQEAKRLLKPDGTLVLAFATGHGGFLATRLHDMLTTVFGREPRGFDLGYDGGTAFVNGARVSDVVVASDLIRETTLAREAGVTPSTDDWPFLYLRGGRWQDVPRANFTLIAILAAISAAWILLGSGTRTRISPHFMFLGGAFLLIEVKGITELALVFGTTWIVSSVVIASILLVILLANLFVTAFRPVRAAPCYAFLAISLLAGYFFPVSTLFQHGWCVAAIGATALLILPLFFAGVIFTTSLRRAPSLPGAFGSNLLGAILGGFCEYASMALGIRNLYLVGLGLYLLSFMTLPRRQAATADASPPEPAVAGASTAPVE